MKHERDEDCTVGPDRCCTGCGVAHAAEPCEGCGARALHVPGCRFIEWTPRPAVRSFEKLLVHCTACDGTGMHRLERALVETLEAIEAIEGAGRYVTVSEVKRRIDFDPRWEPTDTAINNRIARLEALGFVRRVGKVVRELRFELVREVLNANPGWRPA